jgi:hypothetical protein
MVLSIPPTKSKGQRNVDLGVDPIKHFTQKIALVIKHNKMFLQVLNFVVILGHFTSKGLSKLGPPPFKVAFCRLGVEVLPSDV